MIAPKITPGPWAVYRRRCPESNKVLSDAIRATFGGPLCTMDPNADEVVEGANITILAAAPDLAAALDALYMHFLAPVARQLPAFGVPGASLGKPQAPPQYILSQTAWDLMYQARAALLRAGYK